MFSELKNAIELLLNVSVYPLIGPQTEIEFVTLQRISDPHIESGIIRTQLVAARYQISFVSSLYRRTEEMDQCLWESWKTVVQSNISGCPVQYIKRDGLSESYSSDDGGRYRRTRDYIFYCPEDAE